MAEKNYTEFRELLRRGIGSRSIQEFARDTGYTREYISRFLNSKTIKQPTIEAIERLAGGMHSISIEELLKACGYEVSYLEEKIKREENDLLHGLREQFKNGIHAYSSLEDFLETLDCLYMSGKFIVKKIKDCIESENCAEQYAEVSYIWNIGEYEGRIPFVLYFSTTIGGKTFLINYMTEVKKLEAYGIITESHKKKCPVIRNEIYTIYKNKQELLKEKNGIHSFMKILEGEELVSTKIGYGFYYAKTPCKFLDFLMDHAGTFCKTKENTAFFQKAIQPDAEIEKIFSEFSYLDEKGTGAAVAYIMHEESGIDFCYESEYPELEGSKACIMVGAENDTDKIPGDILHRIYDYACELGIKEFGICYYQYMMTKTEIQWYHTDQFHYEYN